jgi:putative DNA primase/helicase
MSTTKAWKLAKTVARHNIRVIPIPPHEKGAKLPNWPDLASSDLSQIQQWEQAQSDGNYGVVCTPDTIVVLDADNPGLRSHIERQTGKDFPDTLTVRSSKGYHYYFWQSDKSRVMGNRSLAGMFDLQSNRKYVVGPGSIHPSGAEYTIINNTDIVPMPDWLADWLDAASTPPKTKTNDQPELADDFEPQDWYDFNGISGTDAGEKFFPDECPISGKIHSQGIKDTAFFYDGDTWGFKCLAGGCPGHDMTIGDVVAFVNRKRRDDGLPVWNKPIWQEETSPLEGVDYVDEELAELDDVSDEEVEAEESESIVSGPKEAKPTESGLKSLAESGDENLKLELVTRSASDYQMEELRWLWPQKIPTGKMVFYTGKPDCGKTMCALDVAARVTTGADWPDGSKNQNGVGKVLIAASEDDPKDTLVPRLAAAGANLSNVEIVVCTAMTVKDKKRQRRELDLQRDAKMLIAAIRANPEIKLLVLDPITSFFGAADQNKDKDVRPIMDSLKRTCEKSGLTILGLIHSNKRSDVDAIGKVSGAGALAASVRAVWGFSRDTEDRKLYHMAHVKGNLTKDKSGLDYSIEETKVTIEGKAVGIPHIVWGARYEGDADDLLASERTQKDTKDTKAMAAKLLIRSQKFPIKCKPFYELAEAEGIKATTLKNAKRELEKEGFEILSKMSNGSWWWYKAEDVLNASVTEITAGHFDSDSVL